MTLTYLIETFKWNINSLQVGMIGKQLCQIILKSIHKYKSSAPPPPHTHTKVTLWLLCLTPSRLNKKLENSVRKFRRWTKPLSRRTSLICIIKHCFTLSLKSDQTSLLLFCNFLPCFWKTNEKQLVLSSQARENHITLTPFIPNRFLCHWARKAGH